MKTDSFLGPFLGFFATRLGVSSWSFTSTIFHDVHLGGQLDNFIFEDTILHFHLFDAFFEVFDSFFVFSLPLICNFLLLNHDLIGIFLSVAVFFLGLKKLVFQLCYLDVALVVEFVNSVMIDKLKSIQLRNSCILLIPSICHLLSQLLVLLKMELIITHTAIKFDLKGIRLNFVLFPLSSHAFGFLALLLTLGEESTVMLFISEFSLVDLLAILLILLCSLLFEVSPLIKHLVKLLLETISLNFLLLLEIKCVGKLDFELGDLFVAGVHDCSVLLSDGFDQGVVSLLFLGRNFLDGVLKSGDLSEILLLLELDSVPLEVGLFDALLALGREVLDGFLTLLVQSHFGLLVLQKRNEMVVFLSPGVELGRHGPELVLGLTKL